MKPTITNKRLLSGSAIYLFSNIFYAAIPFALLPVMTRYLQPHEYGQVAMFQMVVSGLGAFVGLNTQGAANRKWYDTGHHDNGMSDFIGACIQIMVASVVVLLLIPFRVPFAQWLGLEPGWLPWAVAVSAASFLINLRLGQWQVAGEALRYGVLQVIYGLSGMVLSVVLVVLLMQGAVGRISAQIWVAVAFGAGSWALLSKDHLFRVSWRPELILEALRFGVPLVPHVAGLFLLRSVDRAVINDEIGLGAAGIYMVAMQLSLVIAIIFDSINKAYVPWLFERLTRNEMQEKRQIVRLTYFAFAGALTVAALAFAIGPALIEAIAGRDYAAAGELIGWLALGQAFGGMYLMVTNYIFFSKKTGLLSLVSIISGLINLSLLYLLVGRAGLKGAALAFAISMAIRFLLVWAVAHARHPMPWSLPRVPRPTLD